MVYILLESFQLNALSTLSTTGGHDKEDAKARVAVIHTIKDQLKQQNELVKQLKKDLKQIQDKIRAEKEVIVTECMFVYHVMW